MRPPLTAAAGDDRAALMRLIAIDSSADLGDAGWAGANGLGCRARSPLASHRTGHGGARRPSPPSRPSGCPGRSASAPGSIRPSGARNPVQQFLRNGPTAKAAGISTLPPAAPGGVEDVTSSRMVGAALAVPRSPQVDSISSRSTLRPMSEYTKESIDKPRISIMIVYQVRGGAVQIAAAVYARAADATDVMRNGRAIQRVDRGRIDTNRSAFIPAQPRLPCRRPQSSSTRLPTGPTRCNQNRSPSRRAHGNARVSVRRSAGSSAQG